MNPYPQQYTPHYLPPCPPGQVNNQMYTGMQAAVAAQQQQQQQQSGGGGHPHQGHGGHNQGSNQGRGGNRNYEPRGHNQSTGQGLPPGAIMHGGHGPQGGQVSNQVGGGRGNQHHVTPSQSPGIGIQHPGMQQSNVIPGGQYKPRHSGHNQTVVSPGAPIPGLGIQPGHVLNQGGPPNANPSMTLQASNIHSINIPQYHGNQGNPRGQGISTYSHQFAGPAGIQMSPYGGQQYFMISPGQFMPMYVAAQHQQQQHQQAVIQQQVQQQQQQVVGGLQHGGPQGGGGGGQGPNQNQGNRGGGHQGTPSQSPGLAQQQQQQHPGMQQQQPGGHIAVGAPPFEPRAHGHVTNQTGVVNVPPGQAGILPGVHVVPGQPVAPVTPVLPPAPYKKRPRTVALLQDPDTLETIDLGGGGSGSSTPKPSVVSDTSASGSGSVTPSGQVSKDTTSATVPVTSSTESVTVSKTSLGSTDAKETLVKDAKSGGKDISGPSTNVATESKIINVNNSTSKTNLKQNDTTVPTIGSAGLSSVSSSSTSSVPPVALEFKTKVAQSVIEPIQSSYAASQPVIKSSSNSIGNKQQEGTVTTTGKPSVPTPGAVTAPSTGVPSAPVTVTTPTIMVQPGPVNYASMVAKPVNQVTAPTGAAKSAPAATTQGATMTQSTTTPTSAVDTAASSVPKSTSNRSTTSTNVATAPVQPQQQKIEPPSGKVSFANKVSSGPPTGQPNVSIGASKQSNVTTAPTINHVGNKTVTVANAEPVKQASSVQQVTTDLKKLDISSPSSTTTTPGMGSKVSKVGDSSAPSTVADNGKIGVKPVVGVPPKPATVLNDLSKPATTIPAPRTIPKANSTGNLESYHERQSAPAQPKSVVEPTSTVPDSSDGNIVSSTTQPGVVPETSVKPPPPSSLGINVTATTTTTTTKKGLPAIPEVTSSSSKPSSVSSPSSNSPSSTPSPTLVESSNKQTTTKIVNSNSIGVNESKVSSSTSTKLVSANQVSKRDKGSNEVTPRASPTTTTTVSSTGTIESNQEGGDKEDEEEDGRIIEEGELIEDEDAVIEEAGSDDAAATALAAAAVIDPAIEIDRYNKNGKWRYDRNDLINLSKLPLSRSKPPFDTDFESEMKRSSRGVVILLSKPHDMSDTFGTRESPSGNRSENMFLPNWMAGSGGGGGYQGPSSGGNRPPRMQNQGNRPNYYGGRGSQEKTRKIIAPPPTQDVQLHKVSNAWKAGKTPEELDAEEQVTLKLIKEFRGNLNKITPEKYDKILEKIKALEIDTEDRLKRVLELIFDKAVLEPSFCVQYANLCQHLSLLAVNTVNEETGEPEQVKFARLLLERCQKDFERNIYEGIDIEGKMKKIEDETDPDKKKALQTELDEEKRQARKKSLGNIKLIGELYRLGMLKGGIMVNCMHMLINDLEDDQLECLCTLLRTIGGQLEAELKDAKSADGKPRNQTLDPYFSRLRNVVETKDSRVGSRVRFLIQDIIDMRARGWQERERQAVNKPTTIGQIHAEVAAEQHRKDLENADRDRNRRDQTTRRPYGGRMSSPASIGGSSGQNKTNPAELASVIQLLKKNQDQSKSGDGLPTPQLGASFARWGSGAATGSSSSSYGSSNPASGSSSSHHQQQPLPSSAPFPNPNHPISNITISSSSNQSGSSGTGSSAGSIHASPVHQQQQLSTPGSGVSSPSRQSSSSRNTSRSGSPAAQAPSTGVTTTTIGATSNNNSNNETSKPG